MTIVPEKSAITAIAPQVAWQYRIVPAGWEAGKLIVYIDHLFYRPDVQLEIELTTGIDIELRKEEAVVINELLGRHYKIDVTGRKKSEVADSSNTDDFLHRIIMEAKDLKCSDIHIEAQSESCRIRFRLDGKLIERYSLSKDEYPSFVNRIKIKANLDIAEKRLPQDGRILVNSKLGKTDIRVSILPSLHGEKIVLRLLSNDSTHINIDTIGLSEKQLKEYEKVLKKPHGIILISGPTGSGKTTTLYATLKVLNSEFNNILTIEDPIEYTLDGINQVQLKENIGLTFSSALKTFLRQDPDIIMLGEIRDNETAQMAIRAALTGHLVLSTIHTNSAWGTIDRLIDMGVPAFLLANTLNMSVAQRLLRKLCVHCKQERELNDSKMLDEFRSFFTNSETHWVAVGCDQCYYTGYQGRSAVYEVIPIDADMSALIKENTHDISMQLKQRGIHTLRENTIQMVKTGITSIDEAYPILINYY